VLDSPFRQPLSRSSLVSFSWSWTLYFILHFFTQSSAPYLAHPHIHLTILISALTVSQNDNTNRTKAVKSNIVYKVVTANNTHTQYYWSHSYLLQNVIIRQSAYEFYSTLLETMRLSCRPTVLEIERAICRKSPILTYPTCIWRPRWG